MKPWIAILAVVLSTTTATSCSSLLQALPTVIQYVQDAQMILDMIDREAKPFFDKADENTQQEYSEVMHVARKSLQIALRSTKGTDELQKEQVDAAFANFREAYKDLLGILARAGVMRSDGTMRVSPGSPVLDIQEPLVLQQ